MNYLIYDTEAEAEIAQQTIYDFGAILATQAGYTVDAEGIHGMNSGVSDATTAITSKWDKPRQRETDGKWFILHPENSSAAQDATALAALMAMLGTVVLEPMQDGWFQELV